MSDETKKINVVNVSPLTTDALGAMRATRESFRTAPFYYADGTIDMVWVPWPFPQRWTLYTASSGDRSPAMRHIFEWKHGGEGYFQVGCQSGRPVVNRSGFRYVPDEPEPPPPPSRYAVFTHHMHGDTTVIHPDHAQRLRAGLAEREREHVANNPRVIVQPDYPDWEDGEY
jgi:hypothetical protein